MNVLVAVLALAVAGLYVLIALYVVPRLARAATGGRNSKAILLAAVGAGTFLLGCAVTHTVIAYRELDSAGRHGSHWSGDMFAHVIPHVAQIIGGLTFLVVARQRLSVYVVRKDDADRIAELEGRLTHALEAGHLGAWDVDLATGDVWHSAQHDRIFGYDAPLEEWSFERMLGHVPEPHREAVRSSLEISPQRPHAELDCPIVLPDGSSRWIAVTAAMRLDADGVPVRVHGTVADITERREREAQRAALEEQLQNWQRVEAVGRLASGVAHDFNNVLAVVSGWADVLDLDEGLGDDARGAVREIRSASEHGRHLTHELVSVTRQHGDDDHPADVNDVIGSVTMMLQRLVPRNIHVDTDLAAGLRPVAMGPTHLKQVLLNLAINAKDAMPAGGRITFVARGGDERVVIEVVDTGTGMDADTLARIFEPYFTTKSGGLDSGSGLGLSIVHSLVQRVGGTVSARSTPGAGTTFVLELPIADRGGEGDPLR